MPHVEARKLFHNKKRYPDGSIIEMKIWQVPDGLKYSLVYIEKGKRVVGYDNYERKGNHRHYGDKEEYYRFTSVERLVNDFFEDVKKRRGVL